MLKIDLEQDQAPKKIPSLIFLYLCNYYPIFDIPRNPLPLNYREEMFLAKDPLNQQCCQIWWNSTNLVNSEGK